MNTRTYFRVTVAIFALLAAVHILRILNGWEVTIAGVEVPFWLSGVAAVVAGVLAWNGSRKMKR